MAIVDAITSMAARSAEAKAAARLAANEEHVIQISQHTLDAVFILGVPLELVNANPFISIAADRPSEEEGDTEVHREPHLKFQLLTPNMSDVYTPSANILSDTDTEALRRETGITGLSWDTRTRTIRAIYEDGVLQITPTSDLSYVTTYQKTTTPPRGSRKILESGKPYLRVTTTPEYSEYTFSPGSNRLEDRDQEADRMLTLMNKRTAALVGIPARYLHVPFIVREN